MATEVHSLKILFLLTLGELLVEMYRETIKR